MARLVADRRLREREPADTVRIAADQKEPEPLAQDDPLAPVEAEDLQPVAPTSRLVAEAQAVVHQKVGTAAVAAVAVRTIPSRPTRRRAATNLVAR